MDKCRRRKGFGETDIVTPVLGSKLDYMKLSFKIFFLVIFCFCCCFLLSLFSFVSVSTTYISPGGLPPSGCEWSTVTRGRSQ